MDEVTNKESYLGDNSILRQNIVISGAVCFFISLLLSIASVNVLHWSLLPLILCGTLIGADAVAWFRNQVDIFDPKGLIGIVGFHFFFLSPLLQIMWNVPLLGQVSDNRTWLGLMAIINSLGIVIYLWTSSLGFSGIPSSTGYFRLIDPGKASWILPLGIMIAFVAQLYVFIQVGGFQGMIQSHEATDGGVIYYKTGIPRMLGHALPMLVMLMLTQMRGTFNTNRPTFITFTVILVVMGILQFLITGFSGSRSSVIWGVFGIVGVYHYFWRRITPRQVLIGLIPLVLFMYVYGFYKSAGSKAFGLFTGEVSAETLTYKTQRSFSGLLIGDLSRADIQAFELYVLLNAPYEYDLRWGKTYFTSVVPFIPYWIWLNKPRQEKVLAGGDLIYGRGWARSDISWRRSSRVYGLGGEAMLNFSWPVIPIMYGVWGFLVGRFRRSLLYRIPNDARFLLTALVSMLLVQILISDMDNIFAMILWHIAVPGLFIWFISTRVPLEQSYSVIELENSQNCQ
jgi:hypothetical protein